MRITVVTIGSRGDVVPYVALARGLADAGHDVIVATHAEFGPVVRANGLGFSALGPDPREVIDTEIGHAWLESGTNTIVFIRRFVQLTRPHLESLLRDAYESCRDAEAIVYYARLGGFAFHLADKLRVPAIAASTAPFSPTRFFPAVGGSELPRWVRWGFARGRYNLLTHLVAEQLFWQPFRSRVNRWRRAEGLPPMPFLGPDRVRERRGLPMLYGYSPTLVPKPPDWGPSTYVTGFWFLGDPDAVLGEELEVFLAAGPPPVVVGFGSMVDRTPGELGELVVEALRRAGRRGVLLGGWGGVRAAIESDDVLQLPEAPHALLFPRCAAAVHHGGAGTVAAALRAGLPSVAVPFFADQTFWGERIAAAGAGPPPLARRTLTAGGLAAALSQLVDDRQMRERASALGAAIRAEGGVAVAVEAIERELARR